MSKDKYNEWTSEVLKVSDLSKGIGQFRNKMWLKWLELYQGPDFIYQDEKLGGIFSPEGRHYEIPSKSGCLAGYSAGLSKEDKYSRDIFNLKTLKVRKTDDERTYGNNTLYFIAYEAPLLRVTTERKHKFRISADLVAVDTNTEIAVLEAKLPGGDYLDKALLQSYGYAFFLSCHLANARKGLVIEHAKDCLSKFHGYEAIKSQISDQTTLKYLVVAPSAYFYENLQNQNSHKHPFDIDEIIKGLSCAIDIEVKDSKLKKPINPVFGGFITLEDEHPNYLSINHLKKSLNTANPVIKSSKRKKDFTESERNCQIEFKQKSDFFSKPAQANGEYKNYLVEYCIPKKYKEENLFEEIRDDAYKFFKDKNIQWHTSGENHLLSSQAFCVNFLFPFAYKDKNNALVDLFKSIFPGIEKALPIEDDLLVSFEWETIKKNYLKEYGWNRGKRGSQATYPDAVVRFKQSDGKIRLVLIEWKYTETYSSKFLKYSKNKTDRTKIYQDLFDKKHCPIKKKLLLDNRLCFEDLFYEPFDQMFREQFLANEIEIDSESEIRADIVTVLHLGPLKNIDFNRVTNKDLECISDKAIHIWEKLIDNQDRFINFTLEDLFQNFPIEKYPVFSKWWDYMSQRYDFLIHDVNDKKLSAKNSK